MKPHRLPSWWRAAGLVVVLAAPLCAPGLAQGTSFPVDDSASQVLDQSVHLEWESVAPGRTASPDMVGQATVLLRLDVARWRGRVGRIFMSLPPRAGSAVEAKWTTLGRLAPGALRSGERATVFAGVIDADMLEDTLVIRIRTNGELMQRDESLEFRFEIEVDET